MLQQVVAPVDGEERRRTGGQSTLSCRERKGERGREGGSLCEERKRPWLQALQMRKQRKGSKRGWARTARREGRREGREKEERRT